jgi:hypothetical protein
LRRILLSKAPYEDTPYDVPKLAIIFWNNLVFSIHEKKFCIFPARKKKDLFGMKFKSPTIKIIFQIIKKHPTKFNFASCIFERTNENCKIVFTKVK